MRPMTSLVTTPAAELASCPYCGSKRVTTLSMTLTDGSPVDFTSCHRCEGKQWSHDDSPLPLAVVLDRARKRS